MVLQKNFYIDEVRSKNLRNSDPEHHLSSPRWDVFGYFPETTERSYMHLSSSDIFGKNMPDDLYGGILVVTLTPHQLDLSRYEPRIVMREDDVTMSLSRTVTEREGVHYPMKDPSKTRVQDSGQPVYIARFKTGYIAQRPWETPYYNELVVGLSPEEYEYLSQLPENSVMKVNLE